HNTKYDCNQSLHNSGYFPIAGRACIDVQSDQSKEIQKVFPGIHLSAAFYFNGSYVWYVDSVLVAQYRNYFQAGRAFWIPASEPDGKRSGFSAYLCMVRSMAACRMGQYSLHSDLVVGGSESVRGGNYGWRRKVEKNASR